MQKYIDEIIFENDIQDSTSLAPHELRDSKKENNMRDICLIEKKETGKKETNKIILKS